MKQFKHFMMAVALFFGVATANAADGIQTVAPYSVDFNTTISTSGTWTVAKGWAHLKNGTSAPSYNYRSTGGVDGTGALQAGMQSSSSYDDYLITPAVKGVVSLKVKNYSSYSAGYIYFFKMNRDESGNFTVGDTIQATYSADLNATDYVTATLPSMTDGTFVGIKASYVYMDDFAAESADIELFKSLKVVSTTNVNGTAVDCDENGYYPISLTGKIQNTGDLDVTNFTYSIGQYVSSSTPEIILCTKTYNGTIAVGETVEVAIDTTVNVADYPDRKRYDIVENVTGTYAAGSWVDITKYEPILVVKNENGYNMSSYASYAKAFGTFGMIAEPVSHKMIVNNQGAAPMPVKINVPAGFSAEKTEFTVAAHSNDTLAITATAAAPGIYSGNLEVISTANADTVALAVSATVLDNSKFFENFEANNSENTIPAGWYEVGGTTNWTKTTYTNGSNNFVKNSTSSTPTILATPKLKVAEGEKMTFDAARNSTSGTSFIGVYYSTDRKNWNVALAQENVDLTGTSAGTSATATQTWSTFVVEGIPAGEYYIGFESGYASLDNVYGFELVTVAHDVVAKTTKVPATAMVNNEYTATMTALNINTSDEAADSYTATLYFNGEAVATSEAAQIAAGSTADYSFAFTPHAAGTYPAYVKLAWEDGYEVVTDTVEVAVSPESATNTVTVGAETSTATSPLVTNYKNSVSETLYTAAQLAEAGLKAGDKISSIYYRGYNTNAELTTHVKAFIMNCTDSVFGDADVTPDADMTQVFDADYTFPKEGSYSAPANLLVVTFAEPFVYTGGALRVKVQSEADAYKNFYFFVDSNVTGQCYGQRNDNTKVADMTSYSEWKFPVTNFNVALTPEELVGKVVDQEGAPLAGVSIVLNEVVADTTSTDGISMMVAQAQYSGTTDENGNYSIPVVQSDKKYVATYSLAGYTTATVEYSTIGQVADVVLEKVVPTAVTDVTVSKALNSNVYTIDGRIVKQNATTLEGLGQGIYIFQGKKYVVK